MSAQIIDGKKISEIMRSGLKPRIAELKKNDCVPSISMVFVGDSPASEIYVRMKNRACEQLGIRSETINLTHDISQTQLLNTIQELNRNPKVHGILVQLPLPQHMDEQVIIHSILPSKDVDGFHPVNRGKLVVGEETFVPCTPLGIQELLTHSNFSPEGKHVVIVGRSRIVGLPLASIFVQKRARANATITVCHSGTKNLRHFTSQADILIAAIGSPEFIKGEMIKEGAVVIDVGINRVEAPGTEKGYRIVGDVEFESVAERARAVTPVPGGVGPMTIAMLLSNTVKAAEQFCASSSTG